MSPAKRDTVTVDPELGAVLEGRWVPAPRYLLRRDRVLAALADVPPGRVLEVGCGAGALMHDLHRLGHRCTGFEHSEAARAVAEAIHADTGVSIVAAARPDWTAEQFDTLVSCEVLEHIDDDTAALRDWLAFVRPGGRVVLSVPAHPGWWGPSDVWAGHVRRYSKAAFVDLAERAGLRVDRVECLGFPVANLTMVLRNLLAAMKGKDTLDAAASTARSGVERHTEVKLFAAQTSLPGRLALRAALEMQRRFLKTPLGESYLLVASRP
jgi:SAM-dependent methyltransferase